MAMIVAHLRRAVPTIPEPPCHNLVASCARQTLAVLAIDHLPLAVVAGVAGVVGHLLHGHGSAAALPLGKF